MHVHVYVVLVLVHIYPCMCVQCIAGNCLQCAICSNLYAQVILELHNVYIPVHTVHNRSRPWHAQRRADDEHCSNCSCSVFSVRCSDHLNNCSGTWYLVSDTWYQIPEHLFRRPEHLFMVSEHLFVFGEHCSGSALVRPRSAHAIECARLHGVAFGRIGAGGLSCVCCSAGGQSLVPCAAPL